VRYLRIARKRYEVVNPYGRDELGRLTFPRWRSWCHSLRPPAAKFIHTFTRWSVRQQSNQGTVSK
jgi:hypothetical protein